MPAALAHAAYKYKNGFHAGTPFFNKNGLQKTVSLFTFNP
jgi:hypothetical protein